MPVQPNNYQIDNRNYDQNYDKIDNQNNDQIDNKDNDQIDNQNNDQIDDQNYNRCSICM